MLPPALVERQRHGSTHTSDRVGAGHFGDDNPEAPGTIESARVEAPDVFLAHSAYVSHAGRRFSDLAVSFGFTPEDLTALTDMQRNFWTALTFAGPGGAQWDSGDITLHSYLQDHALPLSAVSGILELGDFGSRQRTRIAVRTAALITGLESMMLEAYSSTSPADAR